jgi:hypothetical protein
MANPAAVMTAVMNGRQQGPALHVNISLAMAQLTTQVTRFIAQLVTQVDQLYHFKAGNTGNSSHELAAQLRLHFSLKRNGKIIR